MAWHTGTGLEAAAHGHLTLYTSPVLVAELRTTLSYDRLVQHVERSGLTLDELLSRYLNVAIVIEPVSLPQIVRDPDDDHVLACALAARADLIITGDAHLLTLLNYQNIPILTPADALRRLAAR